MRFSIALAMLLALGASAFAAKEKDAHGNAKKDAHGDTLFVKEGDKYRPATNSEVAAVAQHPTKDFASLERFDLGIYTIIVFLALLAILGKFAWPHIAEGLRKREAAILGARDEANKARLDAEDVRVKLQKDYADAQDKIRAMLDEARRDSEALRMTEREAGTKDAQAERDRARREIQTEKDAVLQELYQQAVQLASLMSAKTIRRSLSADDHRKLLDESLAEIKTKI